MLLLKWFIIFNTYYFLLTFIFFKFEIRFSTCAMLGYLLYGTKLSLIHFQGEVQKIKTLRFTVLFCINVVP